MRNKRNEKYEDEYAGEKPVRRPRWHKVARFLVVLLLVELGLMAVAIGRLNSLGYFEDLPIVKKLKSGDIFKLPEGLEPGEKNVEDNGGEEDIEPDLQVGKTAIYEADPFDKNVLNILVLGLDSRKPGGNGRSDLNMIVSINRKKDTIKLASLLRDTLVPIEGHDWNRLNSAYVFGGPGLAINTVNEVYGMDIQRYIKIDFYAIQSIIDAVGGVDIKLTEKEITYLRSYGHKVSKGAGVKHLNGTVALAYARIRKIDGDFQRTQRQRNVMMAALTKVRSMGVVKAIDLMEKLLPQVKTNIKTNDAIQLAKDIIGMDIGDIKQISIPVQGAYENKKYKGMSVISVDFEKNKDALKSFLYGE